jgi:hypothetical protein
VKTFLIIVAIVLSGTGFSLWLFSAPRIAQAQSGSVDQTFGNGGICTQCFLTIDPNYHGPLIILGGQGGTLMNCAKVSYDDKKPGKITDLSGCKIVDGHSLDEVVKAVVLSDQEERELKDQEIESYEIVLRDLAKQLEEANASHGIPLPKGQPKT